MLEPMFPRELVLRPNCLLTRRPLWITPGPSLLFFNWRNPWRGLRRYLSQHGYMMTNDPQTSAHHICELPAPRVISPSSTLTIIAPIPIENLPPNAFQILIEPHYSERFYAQVLDHCIHLAELDYLND